MNQVAIKKEVKEKTAYYASILTNWVSYGTTIVSSFFLNVYYDTITNENNNDWDPETRKDYLSYLSLFYHLGYLTGILTMFCITKFNPRSVMNWSRVALALSSLFLAIPDIRVMIVSRFVSNFFSALCQITIMWIVYEIYLPRHQSKIMVFIGFSAPSGNFLASFSSKFDTGDAWYWRKILCVMPLALIASTLIDLFATKGLNSVTYQLRVIGKEKTLESVKRVFSEEYSQKLVQKFEKIIQDEIEQKRRLEREGVSQWALDLVVYKHSFINILGVSLLVGLAFQMQYMTNGLIIGSKELAHTIETQKAKTALAAESFLEIASYLSVMILNLIKKRKRSIMTSLFLGSLVLTSSSIGYHIHNLGLVRLGIVALSFSFPFLNPALHLYANDLVPPSLISTQSICQLLVLTIADFVFPRFFDFEQSSYQLIGRKFAILALIGYSSVLITYFWMIETEGLEREQVRSILEKKACCSRKIGVGDGFINFDENESSLGGKEDAIHFEII